MQTFSRSCVVLALMASFSLMVVSALAETEEKPAKDKAEVKSFEFERSWVFPPAEEKKPTMKDIQPIPDERSAIYLKEFGRTVVEPIPEKVNERRVKDYTQMRKLGRGVSNLGLGWMEVPNQVGKATRELDPVSGFLVGGLRGVAFTCSRMCVGAVEIVTFWTPRPGKYAPIIEPEFLTKEMWGDPDPYFGDPHGNFKFDLTKDSSYDMQTGLASEKW